MKILVTGGSGFMGTSLCHALTQRGDEVTAPSSQQCDLRNAASLNAFSQTKYDQIFHLAAWTQAGDFCLTHAGEQWIINQQINTNVLAWWQAQQPQAKLVFMGTSCAYAPDNPLIENSYMQGEPIDSLYTYAMTKRMLYLGARTLGQQFGLRYFCAVPSTLYGPGYHTDGRQMHFIFDLIRKIIRGKEYGEPVILWGDGAQKREVILTDDFVKILLALNATHENEIFNIGAGTEYSIKEFATLICDIVGYPATQITYDPTRYVGAKSKNLSVDKAKAALGSYKLTDLREGISQTVQWFYAAKAF